MCKLLSVLSRMTTKPSSFFTNFHPFLPLLDFEKSPDQYYDDEPCLFWTIVGIASRRYAEDVTLMAALSPPFMDLLWKTIDSPPYTIWNVITLVMISAWPFPAMTMNHSKDVTFSAISLSMSKQIGVHRPKQAREFTSEWLQKKIDYLLTLRRAADCLEPR